MSTVPNDYREKADADGPGLFGGATQLPLSSN